MALTRPILLNVPSFDATQSYTFKFSIPNSSTQIVANKLVIRNQSDNSIVYSQKQETFRYEHIVSQNSLQNGVYYNAVLTVFDAADNESPASVPIQFWCYTLPTVEFTNLPFNNIIRNPSYNFNFQYRQNEGEALNQYRINLYNASRSLVSSSGEIYVQDGTPPYSGTYLFAGFEDNSLYYIEGIAQTINGSIVTTGQHEITVKYTRPDLFTLVELKNNCEGGYVTVKSNIITIEATSNPDPPTFIDNKEVDLTHEGDYVDWSQGYQISGGFVGRLWFRKPNPWSTIWSFSNLEGQSITVKYMQGYENVNSPNLQSYMELKVQSLNGFEYYIYSNYIDILTDNEYYCLWLTRKNNIYQLQLAKV